MFDFIEKVAIGALFGGVLWVVVANLTHSTPWPGAVLAIVGLFALSFS